MSKSELVKSKIKTPVKLEPEVAIAILGLFTAADEGEGIISTEEFPLEDMLEGIGLFENYSEQDFEKLTKKVNSIIDENDTDTLVPSATASLTKKKDRELAYIIAILILDMDEDTPDSEEEYLFELQEALKISDERAEELIDEIFEELEEEEEEE
ncbi:MAG: hypothetical protein EAZ76_01220 [Nostocales cyanobacterium]|nr:MAG: hypothetical protein EAZ87_14020 [Nostocales cyanobacterium]TAF20674.1 MAG: hypothetical protein EAZ76_01220 [Nostocales cyanobacterium]